MTKWVYGFAAGQAEGSAADRDMLGGKGANLAEMAAAGLPVPPGFTIISDAGKAFADNGFKLTDDIKDAVRQALARLESQTGKRFGSSKNPLLISVRSGARVSMPGMMDTILNLGMNDATSAALGAATGNEWFALDTLRRFTTMYGTVVQDVDHSLFEEVTETLLEEQQVGDVRDLDTEAMRRLIASSRQAMVDEYDAEFPQDPFEQLWCAIEAVFKSWNSPRARVYRAAHAIPEAWGTAVTVQSMVFGNTGHRSGTGVAFTRDPSTGENVMFGEFLPNAQGEDIVAGFSTPHSLTSAARQALGSTKSAMQELMPDVFDRLVDLAGQIERHFGDMQDIEFTVDNGALWLLQTRDGKRSANAAIRIAVEMADAGIINRRTALLRVDPTSLDQLLHPDIDPEAERDIIGKGLPAAPGAATGLVVFTSQEAVEAAEAGQKVLLVRPETNPDDIHGMHVAVGVLTSRGGMTSHAAVVARGMGKPCVTGAGDFRIDVAEGTLTARGRLVRKGDVLTIDGNTGEVMVGALPMVQPALSKDFARLMEWADAERRMKVRTNADLPEDALVAASFGAEGIGLCRTEHMFLEYEERLFAMRQLIMAQNADERKIALSVLLPMQREDFVELFSAMSGLPVTVRLLDPPLSDFLPTSVDEQHEVARRLGLEPERLVERARQLRDLNPILGNRGARVAITFPEIADMQVRAIFEAAVEAGRRTGELVVPEIMVPLVAYNNELRVIRDRIDAIAAEVMAERHTRFDYLVGCIIEVPRAAIRADFIAEVADFFSFGTNDLTQTTLGISRDDASVFMAQYIRDGVVALDPFINLDVEGVGELIRIAAEKGRRVRPDLQLSISGEHGGDPVSIQFCAEVGMHYVSCSPYRVPVAKLAAAQAAIRLDGAIAADQ